MTDYAVEARYPGLAESVSLEEYQEAVALAEAVVGWVEEKLRSVGKTEGEGPTQP